MPILIIGTSASPSNQSLVMVGGGTNDDNRAKISLLDGESSTVANLSSAWTWEFFLSATSENQTAAITAGENYNAVNGNAIIDNDRYRSESSYDGSHVITLADGRIVFGVDAASTRRTLVGTTDIRGVGFLHVACTFDPADGSMQIYVNGTREATGTGPSVSTAFPTSPTYPNVCGPTQTASCSFSFPYIVIGAEKHDLDGGPNGAYPGVFGLLSDIRLSNIVRYTGATLTVPSARLTVDANTILLYPCTDSGSLVDSAGNLNATTSLSRSTSGPY